MGGEDGDESRQTISAAQLLSMGSCSAEEIGHIRLSPWAAHGCIVFGIDQVDVADLAWGMHREVRPVRCQAAPVPSNKLSLLRT